MKNIIFDLGNVILNIDYEATIQAFEKLGIRDFRRIFSKEQQNSLSDDFEVGKISATEFFTYLQSLCHENTTYEQVEDAWNAILVNFPLKRLQLLQQLRTHYNLYLLSNTNATHEACYNKMLQQTCGYDSLAPFFDKIYLSHHIGLRKPDPAAWQLIVDENRLEIAETLFLDDSPQHIAAAQQLGIQAIHITPEKPMEAIFLPK